MPGDQPAKARQDRRVWVWYFPRCLGRSRSLATQVSNIDMIYFFHVEVPEVSGGRFSLPTEPSVPSFRLGTKNNLDSFHSLPLADHISFLIGMPNVLTWVSNVSSFGATASVAALYFVVLVLDHMHLPEPLALMKCCSARLVRAVRGHRLETEFNPDRIMPRSV